MVPVGYESSMTSYLDPLLSILEGCSQSVSQGCRNLRLDWSVHLQANSQGYQQEASVSCYTDLAIAPHDRASP